MAKFPDLSPLTDIERHNKDVYYSLLDKAPADAAFDIPGLIDWPCDSRFTPSEPRGTVEVSKQPILIRIHRRYFPVGMHDHYFTTSYLELLFVVSGTVLQQVGTYRSKLEAGDVLLIAPGTKHAFFAMQDDCLIYNLMIELDCIESDLPGIIRSQSELSTFLLKTLYKRSRNAFMIFHTGDYLQGDNRLADLVQAAAQPTHYFRDQSLNITQLLLFDLLLCQTKPPMVSLDEMTNGIDTTLLVEYIRNHSSTVSVKELSEVFNYSERQIGRMFKAATGQAVSEYIQQLRMDHFLSLLVGSDMQISRAMELAGINSTSRFFSQFREQFGLSPVQYRKEFRAVRT